METVVEAPEKLPYEAPTLAKREMLNQITAAAACPVSHPGCGGGAA